MLMGFGPEDNRITMQQAADIHNKRKRHFFIYCVWFAIATMILMSILDLKEGDTREFVANLTITIVLVGGLLAIKLTKVEMAVYRVMGFLISLNYFYNVSIGAGDETVIYWIFILPPVFFFFLGKLEGTVWALGFTFFLGIIMLMPDLVGAYPYSNVILSRFFITFSLVTILCYGLEASRNAFGGLLDDQNRILLHEKERLEQAIHEIDTLSGLIPICAHCKKVRNDEGFWEQVETFVRDRSAADFSHSVCPDCAEQLYSQYTVHRSNRNAPRS
jgi:hypothetical protein